MTTRRLAFTLLVGVSCYVALVLLSARVNPVRNWRHQLDRTAAIERARKVAADFGVETATWSAYASADYSSNADYYLRTRPAPPAAARLAPMNVDVLLVEPVPGSRAFRVELTPDGRIESVEHTERAEKRNAEKDNAEENDRRGATVTVGADNAAGARASESDDPNSSQGARTNEGTINPLARAAGEEWLARLLGADASNFTLVSEKAGKTDGVEGVRFTWEQAHSNAPELKTRAEAFVVGHEPRKLTVSPDYSRDFRREADDREDFVDALAGAGVLLVTLATLSVPFLYFSTLLKRRIRHRQAFALFGVIFVGWLASMLGYFVDKQVIDDLPQKTRAWLLFETVFEVLLASVFVALGYAIVWAVGHTFARRFMPLRIASLVALLRGRLTTSFVGTSVACGVLLGGALAVIPFAAKASNLFPGFEIEAVAPELFVSRLPTLAALLHAPGFPLFVLYALLVPALGRYPRVSRFARPVTILLSAVWMVMIYIADFATSVGVVIVALALAILADAIFRRYDLLTLVVALGASEAAIAAVALLATDAPPLHASGWLALGALALIAGTGAAIHFAGRQRAIGMEIEPDPADEFAGALRVERERIVAEFGVARQAQQRMLPDQPPRIPGYDIAATCRPAREVGGDLYDFLRLPDERVGIVVADVSGKGVPAALYMTLTKGLLASVAEAECDPHRILSEVNRHLYEVCRRKVFVTLILGVLDPATGRLSLARAGHNPTLWRRGRAGDTRSLRAPGLGFGLNKKGLFDKTLKIETIEMEPGDTVLFYSDGITEAMNHEREEYGEGRLKQILDQTDGLSAVATEEMVLANVYEFLGDVAPQDDITLVVLRADATR